VSPLRGLRSHKHSCLRRAISASCALAILSVSGGVRAGAQTNPAATPAEPYLVAYLSAYQGVRFSSYVISIDFTGMTHLNLAFGNPPKCDGVCTARSNMEFSIKGESDDDIAAVVTAAHHAGVKVLLSIGGGGGDQLILQFYNAGLSGPLVASLAQYVSEHHLDGVDVDIEDPSNMGAPFATFVSAVTQAMRPHGLLVTAAVAKYLQDSMPDAALHQFDFINIMNYSSYANAVAALQFYAAQKKIPKQQLVLGLPFFGSAPDDSKEEDYKTLLDAYPNAWRVDMAGGGALDNGQAFSFVGEDTMAQETLLGKQYGGVMIWQLMGDAPPPHSLLKVIQKNLAGAR
jgi:chitinase